MKTITFEERYFKDENEWYYFLEELGVSEREWSNISVIEVTIDGYVITETYI